MSDGNFTYQDVIELEQAYNQAKALVDQIKYVNGYPDYPKTVSQFMLSLSSGKWGNTGYQPSQTPQLIKSIPTATMVDLRSILTACSRSERFGDGNWISFLHGDVIEKVIDRAKELTQTES